MSDGLGTPRHGVRAELSAWGRLNIEEIMSYFTPDAIWDNVPLGPASGYDQIRKFNSSGRRLDGWRTPQCSDRRGGRLVNLCAPRLRNRPGFCLRGAPGDSPGIAIQRLILSLKDRARSAERCHPVPANWGSLIRLTNEFSTAPGSCRRSLEFAPGNLVPAGATRR